MIKVTKPAKENYLLHYKVICPRCEAEMEFDETDIKHSNFECPFIHIQCPECGKYLPLYLFYEIKND